MGDNIVHGPNSDTAAGDTVIVNVNADGPYGVNLIPDADGNAAVIQSFDRLPNGKFGPLQKHGGLHYGDILFEINNTPLANTSFAETMKIVNDRNILKKAFKFCNSKEYYRRKKTSSVRAPVADSKNNFMSAVKRSRISESAGRKYVEFEIASQLIAVSTKVQKEIVYQWSVWKRYSEFEQIHNALKKSLGWQMDGIDIPSAHTFVMNKLGPDFVEQRRNELSDYWNRVLKIDMITDFHKHHCSAELKDFLEVEQNTKKGVAPTSDLLEDSTAQEKPSSSGAPSRRASVKSIRRKASSNQSTAFNYDDDTPSSADVETAVSEHTKAAPKSSPTPTPAAAAAAAPAAPPPSRATSPPPPAPPAKPPAAAAVAAPAPAVKTPPPPVAKSAPVAAPPAGGALPPKATGARMNLFADIASRRID